MTGSKKKLMVLRKNRDAFIQELIEEHRRGMGGGDEEKTMVEVLLSMQESELEYYTDQ